MGIGVTRRALVALVVMGWGLGAKADPIETYTIKNWQIFAYNDEATKAFSHCAMASVYENGVTLIFYINRDREWFMAMQSAMWKLTPGRKYTFSIALDTAQGVNWEATAVAPEAVRVKLESTQAMFEKFSRSSKMTVTAPQGSLRFNLDDSRAALTEVSECTKRNLAKEPVPVHPYEIQTPISPQLTLNTATYNEALRSMT